MTVTLDKPVALPSYLQVQKCVDRITLAAYSMQMYTYIYIYSRNLVKSLKYFKIDHILYNVNIKSSQR